MDWTPEYSQETEDEIMEAVARHAAMCEYEKWDKRRQLSKARNFVWVGGFPMGKAK